jgi:hypothetical protein
VIHGVITATACIAMMSAVACGALHRSGAASSLGAPQLDLPVYDGDVAIDPATGRVRAHWRINFVRQGRQADTAQVLLNSGFEISDVSGAEVTRSSSTVTEGKRIVTVVLAPDGRGEASWFDIAYEGVLVAPSDGINRITPDWVELSLDSFWQPIFGDFGQSITGRVRITLPPRFVLAASGSFERASDSTSILTARVPLHDISFSASPSLTATDSAGTTVLYTGARLPIVGRLLATTEACAAYLNGLYGSRQTLPPRRMVLAPRAGPGYARKNYIVITQIDTAAVGVSRFVCHELAHFWSIRANSSGADNWLNEGFAEFVSAQFVRTTIGSPAYQSIVAQWRTAAEGQPGVWTPTSTRRPSMLVSYRKAPYLLTQLESQVGAELMQRIVTRYMTEEIHTTPELLDVVQQVAGPDAAEWFRELLAR